MTDELTERVQGNRALEFFENPRPRVEVEKALGLGRIRHTLEFDTIDWREECICKFGFSIPCAEVIEAVVPESPLLEVGAGTGYWTKILKDAGADIVATDIDVWEKSGLLFGVDVKKMSAPVAVKVYPKRNVFMSWPSLNMSWPLEAAREIRPGRLLFYLGEWMGATANDDFHEFVEENFEDRGAVEVPKWPCVHDRLYILRRR
jgi:hypothetical protein